VALPEELNGMIRKLTYAAIFLAAFSTFVSRAHRSGTMNDPPRGGDARDYEAIAFNIWKGRGFGYFWSDAEWQEPYRRSPRIQNALGRESQYYPTTYRPPALPFILSLVYAAAGRNFAAWVILNCAFVAAAVTAGAAIAAHFARLPAAPVGAFLILQSPELSHFSREVMTEGMAAFLVSLLAWLWVTASTKPVSIRMAAVSGAVLGALVLARSIFVLWLPIALFMPGGDESSGRSQDPRRAPVDDAQGALSGSRRAFSERWGGRRLWQARAVCILAAVLVAGPWWIRNIVVTRAFLPMGSQGPINLPAGFSQRALDNQGRWRSNAGDGARELIAEGVSPLSLEYEVRLAKIRSSLTMKWMREHPLDVLRLMRMHVWQELRPRRGPLIWDLLLPAAVVALIYFRKSPGALVAGLILCANIFSIAMTWGATGRFMVPVQPLQLALVGAMVVSIAREAWRWLRRAGPDEQPA
jgi:hypothetical protein